MNGLAKIANEQRRTKDSNRLHSIFDRLWNEGVESSKKKGELLLPSDKELKTISKRGGSDMNGLAKIAYNGFENDPRWNELYETYQQKNNEYETLNEQRNPEFVAKNDRMIDRGANIGGGLGLGLGGLAGGTIGRLEAKRSGNGPIRTGVKTISRGLMGAGAGTIIGGITGVTMGLNRGENILQQDDPNLLANIDEAGKARSQAEGELYDREMELEFPEYTGN